MLLSADLLHEKLVISCQFLPLLIFKQFLSFCSVFTILEHSVTLALVANVIFLYKPNPNKIVSIVYCLVYSADLYREYDVSHVE